MVKPTGWGLAVLLVTFELVLAGCSRAPNEEQRIVVGGDPTSCPSLGVRDCKTFLGDRNSPLRLGGVRLEGQPGEANYALHISNVSRSIFIGNLTIGGFLGGILIENSGCATCVISIDQVDAVAPAVLKEVKLGRASCSLGSSIDYVCIANSTGEIRISNVSVRASESGDVLDFGIARGSWGGTNPLVFVGSGYARVHVVDVMASSAGPNAGTGVYFRDSGGQSQGTLSNVSVSGFIDGIRGALGAWVMDRVSITCGNLSAAVGAFLEGGSILIANSKFENCSEAGLAIHPITTAHLRGLTVANNRAGMIASGDVQSPPMVTVSDGVFLSNSLFGLGLSSADFDVMRARIEGNGKINQQSSGGLVSVSSSGSLSSSSFTGNQPFAAVNWGNGAAIWAANGWIVDAPNNWWGSPLGPEFCKADSVSGSAAGRQCASEGVVVVPFRTQP
jgi:hypothetical protein